MRWPFKKDAPKGDPKCGDLRVTSELGFDGEKRYFVERYGTYPTKRWEYTGGPFTNKEGACERMRKMLQAREYGIKVENCDCEGER